MRLVPFGGVLCGALVLALPGFVQAQPTTGGVSDVDVDISLEAASSVDDVLDQEVHVQIVPQTNAPSAGWRVKQVRGAEVLPRFQPSRSRKVTKNKEQAATLGRDLQMIETAEHQRTLDELRLKYILLREQKSESGQEAAEKVKQAVRELVAKSYESRHQRQQESIKRLEQRLELLKQRLVERESKRDQVIDDSVDAVLAGKGGEFQWTTATSLPASLPRSRSCRSICADECHCGRAAKENASTGCRSGGCSCGASS